MKKPLFLILTIFLFSIPFAYAEDPFVWSFIGETCTQFNDYNSFIVCSDLNNLQRQITDNYNSLKLDINNNYNSLTKSINDNFNILQSQISTNTNDIKSEKSTNINQQKEIDNNTIMSSTLDTESKKLMKIINEWQKRIVSNENHIASVDSSVTTLYIDTQNINQTVSDISIDVTGNEENISTIQTDISTLVNIDSELFEKINKLENRIKVLENNQTTQLITAINYKDTFDSDLNGWEFFKIVRELPEDNYYYDKTFNDYSASIQNGTVLINGDGFVSNAGITKTFDISNRDNTKQLYISFDYKATSDHSISSVTNVKIDIVSGDDKITECIVCGGTKDTDWQSYTSEDISILAGDNNSITISLYLNDSWLSNYSETNQYDNFILSDNYQTVNYLKSEIQYDYTPSVTNSTVP